MLGVGGMHSTGDGLGLGGYDSQWSAQLMCDVGQKAAAPLIARLQARRHRVERSCHRAQLSRPVLADPSRVVALFDAAGGSDQVVHGTRETAHAAPGDEDEQ